MKVIVASFTCTRCEKDNERKEVIVHQQRALDFRYRTGCTFCGKLRYTPIINPQG